MLTALGIGRAVFVGTSRGGILTMLLAAARPTAIAGCVLNDIGPVIDLKGLMRIKSYVGKLPQPASFRDAAEILRRLFGSQFPKLSDDDWLTRSRAGRSKKPNGRLVPDYDVDAGDHARRQSISIEPLPDLWKEFDALAQRAGDGDSRQQFRHSLAGHGRRDAGAPCAGLDVVEVPDRATHRCSRRRTSSAASRRSWRPARRPAG